MRKALGKKYISRLVKIVKTALSNIESPEWSLFVSDKEVKRLFNFPALKDLKKKLGVD